MPKYNAICSTETCTGPKRVFEVKAEGVRDDQIIGQVCAECGGALRRIISAIHVNIGATPPRPNRNNEGGGWFDRLGAPGQRLKENDGRDADARALRREIASGERQVEAVLTVSAPSGDLVDIIFTETPTPKGDVN